MNKDVKIVGIVLIIKKGGTYCPPEIFHNNIFLKKQGIFDGFFDPVNKVVPLDKSFTFR